MGRQQIVPAAAAAIISVRRLFSGSCVNQRGLWHGSPLATVENGFCRGVQKFNTSRYPNGIVCRENNRNLTSQLGSLLCRTFSQATVQLAKDSTQATSGKKKRGPKTAAEIASHNAATQMRPIVFECSVCRANCVTRILKDPYDRGVTILRCMDCRSVNLISDQLGLFKEPGSMQRFLRERGVDVRNGPEGRYELTPESIAQTQQPEPSTATA
ncbi:unnamed protein product [Calypogeia fissa]